VGRGVAGHRKAPCVAFRFPILALAVALATAVAAVPGEAWSDVATARSAKADQVVVLKGERRLLLLRAGEVLRSYRVALGFNPLGQKQYQGDGRTPEGRYVLDWRNSESEFYRSIHVSYPSATDLARAQARGVSPGGNIMIHGLPNGLDVIGSDHAKWDWTEGCIAVTNAEMDEIWSFVEDGTPIEIRP